MTPRRPPERLEKTLARVAREQGIDQERLSEVLKIGFDQFTFRVKSLARDMEQADTIRMQVAVQYKTRSWQTIEVDLGPAKLDHTDLIEPKVHGLEELGVPVTSPV